jgi:hypothetical protein
MRASIAALPESEVDPQKEINMRISLPLCCAATLVAFAFIAPAQAQNVKSFVASTGLDTYSCATEAAPCRTLGGAHGKTNSGGTIYCLDNGEFSGGIATNITKSITIDCTGTGGSIKSSGIGIRIGAATTDIIHIRGLKISSTGLNPVYINNTAAAASVRIDGCDIVADLSNSGIILASNASGNVLELFIANTTITKGNIGVNLNPNGGGAKVTLDNVRIVDNVSAGINASGDHATTAPGLQVVVKNSTITGNTSHGINAFSATGTARIFVKDSVISHNGSTGIIVGGANAAVFVSGSAITQNSIGLAANFGATLFTYGNNQIHGNFSNDGLFTTFLQLN